MKFTFLKKFILFAALAAAFALQSCSDDPDPIKAGQAGFYVVNEGAFGNNNTSVSFFDRQTGELTNDVFFIANNRPLGDQAQSMTVIGNKGYIVVQGSNKIEVINTDDFSSLATITAGLNSPRYLLPISSTKAYVSDWGATGTEGTIKVLDLTTNTITATIPAGTGTNRMIKVNNTVYAANSGGYGNDSTVVVVDITKDKVTDTLSVGYNPNSLQADKNGNLWVGSTGLVVYTPDYSAIDFDASVPGSITKFNTSLKKELTSFVEDVTYTGVASLSISNDGTQLYYLYNDAIYTMSTSSKDVPKTPFKTATGSYYGLAVDPFDGSIIGCQSLGFTSAGKVDIMDSNGNVKSSFTAGISPNGCAFK